MKVKLIVFGSVLSLVVGTHVFAKDLGVFGQTFPIQEQDLLEVIATKLKDMEQTGAIALHQQRIQNKLKKSIMNPRPLHLPEATEERAFYYSPTLIVENDLRDHKGQIFHKKGEKINPLDHYQFRGKWIFFDATSKKQCLFAKANYKPGTTKLILINGSPLKLMKKWQIPLFFDQQGLLSKKLAIKRVPAIVEQAGHRLKISEVDLNK